MSYLEYSNKLRVLHVITSTGLGGAERMLQKLLVKSGKEFFETKVISIRPAGQIGEELEKDGFNIRHLDASGYAGMIRVIPSLVREFRDFKPDVVQGWMYHANLAASFAMRLAHRNAPVVWNVRHSLEDLKNEKINTLIAIHTGAFLSQFTDTVIYNARSSFSQHANIGYTRKRVQVIPNGFDTDTFKPSPMHRAQVRTELKVKEDDFLIGLIARYHPVKGHADFLQAAALCLKTVPNVRFLMVGKYVHPSNPELMNMIRSYGLNNRVILLGKRNDTHRLYPALDLFVLSSLGEGFPNVLGEAMASCVPCVATDTGDSAWIVGDTGRIVPSGKPGMLGKAMADMLMLPEDERSNLGSRARVRIIENFSLSTVIHQYESLYRSLALKRN